MRKIMPLQVRLVYDPEWDSEELEKVYERIFEIARQNLLDRAGKQKEMSLTHESTQ